MAFSFGFTEMHDRVPNLPDCIQLSTESGAVKLDPKLYPVLIVVDKPVKLPHGQV